MAIPVEFKGARFAGTFFGGRNAEPIPVNFKADAAISLVKGDLVRQKTPVPANNGSHDGDIVLAATDATTGQTGIVGVCNQTKSFAAGEDIPVITNPDAVYAYYSEDDILKVPGAKVNIAGASGAQTATDHASSGNNDTGRIVWPGEDNLVFVMLTPAAQAVWNALNTAAS